MAVTSEPKEKETYSPYESDVSTTRSLWQLEHCEGTPADKRTRYPATNYAYPYHGPVLTVI